MFLFNKIKENSKRLFERQGMALNWDQLSKLKRSQQIYTLVMISPFSVSEKQKLLEIPRIDEIGKTFVDITNFSFFEDSNREDTIQ